MSTFINLLQTYAAPEITMSNDDAQTVKRLYRSSFRDDPAMKMLLAEGDRGDESSMKMAHRLLSSRHSLDDNIHGIFQYNNFAQDSSEFPANLFSAGLITGESRCLRAWHTMSLAMVLASQFLLHQTMEPFWFRLLCGQRVGGSATRTSSRI
jgi:hypothetical protein